MRTGGGPAIGPHTGRRCWPLLAGLWRAIAPLMKPRCAVEEVPTAANLNLHRGRKSRVWWHCDNEPLFGKSGHSMLSVSVSFGSRALSSDGRASPVRTVKLARAGLAMTPLSRMPNVRTSFFTVRIPVWNRSGLTLRSVGSGNMLLPVPCGQEQCVVCQRVCRVHLLLLREVLGLALCWAFWVSLEPCAYRRERRREGTRSASLPLMCTGQGLRRCAYHWTRPLGGGRWEHYLHDPRGAHWFVQKCASSGHGDGRDSIFAMLCVLALAGLPSLHGCCACLVLWVEGHSREIAGKMYVSPLFLVLGVFCFVETLLFGGGVRFSGICGLVGPVISWTLILIVLQLM